MGQFYSPPVPLILGRSEVPGLGIPDKCGKSRKNDVALAWFKNNNEIIHFDPTSGLLLEDKDSIKQTFNNSSGRFSDSRWRSRAKISI